MQHYHQSRMYLQVMMLGLTVVSLVSAEDLASSTTQPPKSDRSEFKKSLSRDCATSYSATCLKLDIVSWVDKLNEEDNYSVLPGVSMVRENGSGRSNTADIVAELARDFPNDPDARLDAFLYKKLTGYLSTHSVKLNLWDTAAAATDIATGRGSKGGIGGKKDGGLGMLLAAGAMMKGTLGALALAGLAAIAGKALMTALISLMLSAIIGLKSLSGGGGKTTYEVISKPVYTQSHTHSSSHEEHGGGGGGGGGGHYGHSSYGRSFDIPPLPLGLQPGYKPPQ